MELKNITPFPNLKFESRDEQLNDFGVVVLRGTFDIQDGSPLSLSPTQEPIVFSDEYFGTPGESSLRVENNLAPYKPSTDVHVVANAHSPYGMPGKKWNVGIQVGSVNKELTVTGPRKWVNCVIGKRLSEIKPVAEVPLRYELAYGGSIPTEDHSGVCLENPAGIGVDRTESESPVPQIFPAGYADPVYGVPIPVAGFGPLAPAWSPRREKAGTFNGVWKKTRWPDLPTDFSFDFYNSAGAGLTMPEFVKGDEKIVLTNMTRDGELSFQLPGFELATLMRFEDGRIVPGPVQLDTIHIDVPNLKVFLTWRGLFPAQIPMRAMELRMSAPDRYISDS